MTGVIISAVFMLALALCLPIVMLLRKYEQTGNKKFDKFNLIIGWFCSFLIVAICILVFLSNAEYPKQMVTDEVPLNIMAEDYNCNAKFKVRCEDKTCIVTCTEVVR